MALKKRVIFAIGIVLTFIIISMFGLSEVVSAILSTDPTLLAAAALLELVVLALAGLRLKILTYGKGYLSYKKALRTAVSGAAVSLMTPLAMIGGEPLKMYMLRSNIGNTKASAVVAVDGLMEIMASILAVFLITVLFIGSIPSQLFTVFAIFLIVTALILGTMLKILLTPGWISRVIGWIVTRIQKSQNSDSIDYPKFFQDAFYSIIRDKAKLVAVLAVSIILKIAEMARLWLVFAALGVVLPSHMAIIGWAVIVVLLFVPVLPGSLAVVEFGAASALVLLGLSGPIAASGILLDRFLSFWLVLIIGLAALSRAKGKGELPGINRKSTIM